MIKEEFFSVLIQACGVEGIWGIGGITPHIRTSALN
jgi:hypothetical protein